MTYTTRRLRARLTKSSVRVMQSDSRQTPRKKLVETDSTTATGVSAVQPVKSDASHGLSDPSRVTYSRFGVIMATNKPTGDHARKGAVKTRSQVLNPHTNRWVKRDATTGLFMDQKADPRPFKGVRKER